MGKVCVLCQITDLNDNLYIDAVNEIEEIIHQHFGIQINSGNQYQILNTKCICTECMSVTVSFHKLYRKVQQNILKLLSTELSTDDSCYIQYKNNDETLKDENCYDDKDILVDNDNSLVNHQHLLVKNQTKLDDIEVEHVDLKNYENYHNVDVDFSNEHDFGDEIDSNSFQNNDEILNKEKNDEVVDNDDDRDIDIDDDDVDDVDDYEENNYNEKSIPIIDKTNSKTIKALNKKKNSSDEENQQIKEFFKMTCDLCDYNFNNFSSALSHYSQVHKRTGYLVCCNKKFFQRSRIFDHVNRHLNPEAFKCIECNKIFSDSVLQKIHMTHFHTPIDQRKYKCEICPSSFAIKFKLTQHMQFKHCPANERKFKCSKCEKSFITKSILAQHVRAVHELAYARICHICAKTFKTRHFYETHVREHMTVVTKQQCKICNAWLKNENGLRSHMSRHAEGKVACKICDKVAPNRNALSSHMQDVHGNRKHKCTICEKAFTKSRDLKKHIISHTGEELYSCLHCTLTFKSSGVLKSHVKKSHADVTS